jgi:hypothetical protein
MTWDILLQLCIAPVLVMRVASRSSCAQSLNSQPETDQIDGHSHILYCSMTPKDAEDVEDVVPVVCQCERMDYGVVMDGYKAADNK